MSRKFRVHISRRSTSIDFGSVIVDAPDSAAARDIVGDPDYEVMDDVWTDRKEAPDELEIESVVEMIE